MWLQDDDMGDDDEDDEDYIDEDDEEEDYDPSQVSIQSLTSPCCLPSR